MQTQFNTCSGHDRITLMVEKDHDLKIRSLLKYHMTGSHACTFVLMHFVGANVSPLKCHMTGLRLLGMCAAGKNQATKDICASIHDISFQKCICNFLDLDQKQDGA